MPRVAVVVGARPQFVKAAALAYARSAGDVGCEEFLVHTGQHHGAMSEVFFDELPLPTPAHHLGVAGGSHAEQTGRMLLALDPVFAAEDPDAVLVFGDTNSTLAATLVAVKRGIPVVHVEAGVRSFDWSMPEEVNRVLVDRAATLRCCPSVAAADRLADEGIRDGVHVVGDVMQDVLVRSARRLGDANPAAERLGLPHHGYVLATVHRAVVADDAVALGAIVADFAAVAAAGLSVVWPVHPRTRLTLGAGWTPPPGVVPVEPLGHLDTVALARGAAAVATDSGGLQKEAVWLGTPVVILRDATEWPELVTAGAAVLSPPARGDVADAVLSAAAGPRPAPQLTDDDAAARVYDAMRSLWS